MLDSSCANACASNGLPGPMRQSRRMKSHSRTDNCSSNLGRLRGKFWAKLCVHDFLTRPSVSAIRCRGGKMFRTNGMKRSAPLRPGILRKLSSYLVSNVSVRRFYDAQKSFRVGTHAFPTNQPMTQLDV